MGRDVTGKEIERGSARMRFERIENEWETYGSKDPVKTKSKVKLYIYTNATPFLLPVTPPNHVLQSVRRVYTRYVGSKVTMNRLRKNIYKKSKVVKILKYKL